MILEQKLMNCLISITKNSEVSAGSIKKDYERFEL